MKKTLITLACVIVVAVVGFSYGRLRSRANGPTVKYNIGFEPYTIKQRVDFVGNDGSSRHAEDIVVYTASDGGLREIHTRYDANGQPLPDFEQIKRPGVGSFFVFHKSRLVQQYQESVGPIPYLTGDYYRSKPEFLETKTIAGVKGQSWTVYVLRDEHQESWMAEQIAIVPLRLEQYSDKGKLLRTTLEISPGDELNALQSFNTYTFEKALVKQPQ